ncbi:MAG TPA: hypothetical protein VJQ47_15145 [Steroidobacteraceae bacterium]|nr:hypothetical protein [Steroidobacteraceae bacterium]
MNGQRGFVKAVTRVLSVQRNLTRVLAACLAGWMAVALTGCSGRGSVDIANSQGGDPATVDAPIFYVKRTVPKQSDDLRVLRPAVPKADLFKRASASASAPEVNITARITGTDSYDIKDVDASVDGKKIAFAMRGPLTMNMDDAKPPFWQLWEYDIAGDTLTQVLPASTSSTGNDVAPHFMPDGRIVFASTRQRQSQAILLDENKPQFEAQDENRTESAFVLHVVTPGTDDLHQISFNQSNDSDPTVLLNGRILWSRWDHIPGKDGIHLYTSNPDGTDVQLYYGANSHATGTKGSIIEFVKPREMQDGRILTLVRPYTNVDFGGDLVLIDGKNYVENTQPTLDNPGGTGPAQTEATQNDISTVPGPSPGGRFNSAYPLWDGTNRIIVSWSQCRLLDNTQNPPIIVPCTDARLADPNAQAAPPIYSLWMFDPSQNTLTPIIAPVEGVMYTDVVVAQARQIQNIILDGQTVDPTLKGALVGVLDIKSVYDFDGVDTAQPSIAALADPAATTAAQRPARFVRLEKAVSIPDRDTVNLAGSAFGASNFMREILGYAPIEPDGSVRVEVPPDVAFQISVLDANGRRIFSTHNAWLQVRAGEVVTCNGCHAPAAGPNPHSHGRANLFKPAYGGATTAGQPFPHTLSTYLPNAGETMAEARARTTCTNVAAGSCSMRPSMNVYYSDVWTDPTAAGRAKDVSFDYSYNNTLQFATPVPARPASCVDTPTNPAWNPICRTVINYTKHIQALWDLPRQTVVGGVVTADHTCSQSGCHSTSGAAANTVQAPAGQLNLTSAASDQEPTQPISYRHLLFTHNQQEVNMGALQDTPGPLDAAGNPTAIPVGPYMNAGSANGALSSAFLGRFAPGSGSTHAGWLSPAELRLISEWLDIGAQFFNDPFDPAVPVN